MYIYVRNISTCKRQCKLTQDYSDAQPWPTRYML